MQAHPSLCHPPLKLNSWQFPEFVLQYSSDVRAYQVTDQQTKTSRGHNMMTLIDQDIAHITRVMQPSLHGDLGGPILPPSYWRERPPPPPPGRHASHTPP